MTIAPVFHVLNRIGAPVALIGAHALAARGYARFTVDIDLLTTDVRVLDPDEWAALLRQGASVDVRRGDDDDPLAGVVHVQLVDGTDIDLIVGRWPWQRAIIDRAESMAVMGTVLRVPQTGDLILLKLHAGGYIDKQDIAALLSTDDRTALVRDVEVRVGEVFPDVTGLWRDVRASVP